ncbi:aminomethyltransferase [Mixta theicola]|uniref:Aminomethyltransferase n=1 Tax=Mixta theicola TaxID=1458355 RepID=A0A2K1QEI1_9GAMM|nr:aminomethyltransferase family protein [Mixta theicola]PNS13434.1 aminomethyltransferase [Mixta theicola]GLR09749.1 aminomethyltransferase [Mixta theicola]
MKVLHDLHLANQAKMGRYNEKTVPASYHSPAVEYQAVRENALLVDYSHMSIVSVMGEDAWALVNYCVTADVSTLRDEQALYSLVLNDEGVLRGDVYILCAEEGYYLLTENMTSADVIACLHAALNKAEELDIQQIPEIDALDEARWGAVLLEGPYSWEVLAEIYGFDVIGLPYHEFMHTAEELILFRCGKHGEYAYLMVGEQARLADLWLQLLDVGEKFQLKTGGLDYQQTVRIENPCWDASGCMDGLRNPVEMQLQWAIQYDKENFIGKTAVEEISRNGVTRRLIGIIPLGECAALKVNDKVLVDKKRVGQIVKSTYSPARQSMVALAMIDAAYAYSDIQGFTLQTAQGDVAAMTQNLPFLYNLSMRVSPTEHSFIDATKLRRAE